MRNIWGWAVSTASLVTVRSSKPQNTALIFIYSYSVFNPIWISADYQFIANPADNADCGPVNIYGLRAHVEF